MSLGMSPFCITFKMSLDQCRLHKEINLDWKALKTLCRIQLLLLKLRNGIEAAKTQGQFSLILYDGNCMSDGIYIDFEGNKDKPPTFLGVLERSSGVETFRQYILEDVFAPLAPSAKHPQLIVDTIQNVLRGIDDRHNKNTPVYAWSTREQTAIDGLLFNSELSKQWAGRVIDAKQLARRWARIEFPNHQFKKTEFRGRHTLDQYLDLIEYNVPTVQGAGKTGVRLTSLRETLIKGQPIESWPPSKKKYWTNLLAHNMHDCYGMMAIIDRISADAKS
jgi:hypothetical protein